MPAYAYALADGQADDARADGIDHAGDCALWPGFRGYWIFPAARPSLVKAYQLRYSRKPWTLMRTWAFGRFCEIFAFDQFEGAAGFGNLHYTHLGQYVRSLLVLRS